MNQKVKYLSSVIAIAMSVSATQAHAADDSSYKKIGDLEIYKAAQGGAATLSLMLDISQSMHTMDVNGGNEACFANQRVFANKVTYYLYDESGNKIVTPFIGNDGKTVDPSKGISTLFYGCPPRNDMAGGIIKDQYLQRIARLKKSLLDLFSDGAGLDSRYKIGLGTFPLLEYGYSGAMHVPARPLTPAQRWELMRFVVDIVPTGTTPAAMAYAEAGAYMLGNKTANTTGQSYTFFSALAHMDVSGSQWRLRACLTGSSIRPGMKGYERLGSATDPSDGQSYKYSGCQDPIDIMDASVMAGNANTVSGTNFLNSDIDKLDFSLLPNFTHIIAHAPNGRVLGVLVADRTNAGQEIQKFRASREGGLASSFLLVSKRNYADTNIGNSGFGYSRSSTKTADGQRYVSPMDSTQCDGYGIYFLTDGGPTDSNSSTLDLMKNALADNTYVARSPALSDPAKPAAGWEYIGPFARTLREEKEIKTAVVAFGSSFTPRGGLPTKQVAGETVVDCDSLTAILSGTNIDQNLTDSSVKNLCRWGERSYGYGEGGFLATSEPAQVTENIKSFAATLNQTIPTSPAGTISIPRDPLSVNNIQPYAYMPMIQPEVGKNLVTWAGNLKKYHTLRGTLYGQGNARLYVPNARNIATEGNANFPAALNPQAMDIWQTGTSKGDNASVDIGGARSQLKMPTATSKSNVRTVYVEKRIISGGNVTGSQLVKVGTDGTRLIGFDNLGDEYGIIDRAYILNFLGFGVPVEMDAYVIAGQDNSAAALTQRLVAELGRAEVHTKPTLGGVLHSVPVLASYSGQLDTSTGNITSDEALREDHLLYGSMDGALHMVTARTGEETFSFIPRAMFDDEEQVKALKVDNTYERIGQPKFGVDAPWSTKAVYEYEDSKMTAKKMYAYGGLRMGGVGLYGLNITDRDNPRLMFSINNQSPGFERLGQTWSKPLAATIQTGSKITDKLDVLIFGGGYDMCYENPLFKLSDATNADAACANKTQAQGNAVYMINAKTGRLLQTWTATGGSATDDRRYMNHSITGEIVGLDRNNNGHVDSLYFGDLGGQLFRIDLQEGSETGVARRVVRVLDSNAGALPSGHIPFRFYEKPEISFYDYNNARLALVNIATGDRSSPMHRRRTLQNANRIYGIIDRDLASPMTASSARIENFHSRNLTNDSLHFYDTARLETGTDAYRKGLMDDLKLSKKQGWYYNMDTFDGRAGIKHLKSVGPGTVLGGIYYASVYNPDYSYTAEVSCQASIAGGTERQMFCLPWGICATSNGTLSAGSTNGKLGYMKAGPGIQELAIASITNTAGQSTNIKALVGMQTVAERGQGANGQGGAGGGNPFTETDNQGSTGRGSGADVQQGGVAVEDNRVLQVKRWYDLQTAEEN